MGKSKFDNTENTFEIVSNNNDVNMKTVGDNPITREEMATYLTFLSNSINENAKIQTEALTSAVMHLEDAYNKKVEALTTCFATAFSDFTKAFVESKATENKLWNQRSEKFSSDVTRMNTIISNHTDTFRKVMFAVANNNKPQSKVEKPETNPIFKNTLLPVQSNKWISDVWDSCEIIGRRCNKNKLQVLMDVYRNIEAGGLDLTTLHSEWKNTEEGKLHKAKVHMCACDAFRPKVEEQLKVLHKKYFPEKYENKDKPQMRYSKSLLAQRNPECVTSIIKAYGIKNNISFNKAQSKLYRKLAAVYNVENVSVLAKRYAKLIGYSVCNSGYMIANNEEMFKKFKAIAEEE